MRRKTIPFAACRIVGGRELRRTIVANTVRLVYDAAVAMALTIVVALVVSLVAAVIVGANAPNVFVALAAFAFTGAILVFRWRGGWLRST